MRWKIGNVTIENQVVIAPMAGVTDAAYRKILKEHGAGLLYTEMISDKGLGHGNQKTVAMIAIDKTEKPIALQLFGSEPDSLARAARFVEENSKTDIIDINMGCPVAKVIKGNSGVKLMQNEDLAYAIFGAVVKAVKRPVTVKIRSGWDKDSINAVKIAQLAEMAGISAVAVHGRTKTQLYYGRADWQIIKDVKASLSIPVIGNGDVSTPEDAARMIAETGCDAVMIGRAVLGNPWLVQQTKNYLETGIYDGRIKLAERRKTIEKHLELLIEDKGERVAVMEMRTHGAWYLKGLKDSTKIKPKIVSCLSVGEFRNIIDDYFSYLQTL